MFKYQGIDKAINNALIFAAIQFILTIVLMALGVLDMWSLLDLVALLACGLGIKKHSRVAAVTMLLFFVVGRIFMLVNGASGGTLVMAIFGVVIYGHAVKACFDYRKHHAHGEDDVMVY